MLATRERKKCNRTEMAIMFLSNTPFSYSQTSKYTQNRPKFSSTSFYSSIPSLILAPFCFPSSSSLFTVTCRNRYGDTADEMISSSSPYDILGVDSTCSAAELKSAFRARVKEFHPDVRKDGIDSDMMIRLVIQAYEMLSNYRRSDVIESCRECVDPFEDPECEAIDVFVNESLCVGRGCPYSCVERAPHAFRFSTAGTARPTSQGHADDYQVQLAVGQCPRNCIHYVTPSQRLILEELLDSIINVPYDGSAESDLLYSLIVKAKFENNRYRKPKKQAKASTEHVDWF